jgi:aminoglycoside phosphotransferase family enzyme
VTGSEVHEIAGQGVYENALLRGEVEETHISWIILTKQYAFKI